MSASSVWKFELPIDDTVYATMPDGAEVLSVQAQFGVPCIWVLVDPAMPKVTKKFHWRGTGHPLGDVGAFVGTVQLHGGSLVFHLFEASK